MSLLRLCTRECRDENYIPKIRKNFKLLTEIHLNVLYPCNVSDQSCSNDSEFLELDILLLNRTDCS